MPALIPRAVLPALLLILTLGFSYITHANTHTISAPEVDLNFGGKLQPVYYFTDSSLVSKRDRHDVRLRRARLWTKGSLDGWIKFNLQGEYHENPKSGGADTRIVDAYVHLKPSATRQLYLGQFMVPVLRQNATSSGGLMTFDRPGIIYKSLNWGTRALSRFSTLTMNNTDAGLRGNVDVRDLGIMFMSVHDMNTTTHIKYHLAVTEGARSAQGERFAARAQINWGDTESGLFQNATYFGAKDTISLGVSIDQQANVAIDQSSGNDVGYQLQSIDLFAEKPLGSHSINVEAAYINLDLDSAEILLNPDGLGVTTNSPLNGQLAVNSQGSGFYIQSGLTFNKWQPWFGFEQWQSDADDNSGSYSTTRVGLTYHLHGHRTNIKVGYEITEAEQAFTNSLGSEDRLATLAAGLFISF